MSEITTTTTPKNKVPISLSRIVEQAFTEILHRHGAFYAFSNAQVEQGRGKWQAEELCSLGSGLYCPEVNAIELIKEQSAAFEAGIKKREAAHTADAIIEYELTNHESWYTGDINDAMEALAPHNYTRQQVLAVYRNKAKFHQD